MGGAVAKIFGGGSKPSIPEYDADAARRSREEAQAAADAKVRAEEQRKKTESQKAAGEAAAKQLAKQRGVRSTISTGGGGLDDEASTLKKKLGA